MRDPRIQYGDAGASGLTGSGVSPEGGAPRLERPPLVIHHEYYALRAERLSSRRGQPIVFGGGGMSIPADAMIVVALVVFAGYLIFGVTVVVCMSLIIR